MRAEPGCGGEHEAAGDGLAIGPAPRDDRDRGERGAHPGRAGGRSDDAFDGAVGAARRPVIALRADLKVVVAARPIDFRKSVHTLSALESEASGVGRHRHGAGEEVAAPGTLHLAADPRRRGASERDPAHDAARWTRLDAGLAKACEATGSCRMICRISLEPMASGCIFWTWRFVPTLSRPMQRL